MTRRSFIATTAATAAAAAAPALGRCKMGFTPDSFAILRPPRTALEFLERAHSGRRGRRAGLARFVDPDYLKKVRQKKEELGMYLEVLSPLPGPDTTQFEKTLRAAREAGAEAIRTACLSGRRYETFDTLEKWKTFVADSTQKIERALPIANKYKLPVGIENHKDWTVEEYVAILKKYSSEYLGVCIDFGNNISLLDDPMEVVEIPGAVCHQQSHQGHGRRRVRGRIPVVGSADGQGHPGFETHGGRGTEGSAQRQILARHAHSRPVENHLPDREILGDFSRAQWQVPGAHAGHGQEEQVAAGVAARNRAGS